MTHGNLEIWPPEGGVERVQLDSTVLEVTVGRSSSNDIVVDDPLVSRKHAVFERLAAGWSIHDLRSTNGTYVNGEPLDGSRPLYNDDQVHIGETRIVYKTGVPQ
jgi:pSer/pThr/pTyr-binding forkhead associated (FHA) protein